MSVVAVEDLKGWRLDYAIAHYVYKKSCVFFPAYGHFIQRFRVQFSQGEAEFAPSENWSDAGALITMEGVNLLKTESGWKAFVEGHAEHCDYFPLAAAMRAVLSANGITECEIPYTD